MERYIGDIIIILILLVGFISGYKKGLLKQVVSTVGLIFAVFLAFLFKNNLSILLYKSCPFFTVGLLKNYSSLNILLYEIIAFFILFFIFGIILLVIVRISGLIERIVEDTVVKVPLKILGGILGVIENYVILFVILLVVCSPISTVSNYFYESKLKDFILNNTILISNISKPLTKSINEVKELEIKKKIGDEEFNCEMIDIFKKNKIVSEESINYLIKQKKLNIKCK